MASPVCAARGPVFCIVVTEFISFVTLIAATLAFQALHQDRDVCSSPCPLPNPECSLLLYEAFQKTPQPATLALALPLAAGGASRCSVPWQLLLLGRWVGLLPNRGRSTPTHSRPRGPYSWGIVGKEAGEMK